MSEREILPCPRPVVFVLATFPAFTELPEGLPYRTSNANYELRVERRSGLSYDEPYVEVERWAVYCGTEGTTGNVLSRNGEFDSYEPRPSSRTDEWLRDHRFDTQDEAFAAAYATVGVTFQPHRCDRYVNPGCQTCWPDGGMREQGDEAEEAGP